jgi:mono/diheme cytochrome c family protein
MLEYSRFLLAFSLLAGLVATASGCKRKQIDGDTHVEVKHLFDSVCARCHGSDGRGGVPSAEGQPAPRNFRDPSFHSSRTDADLTKAIREGKGPMPPFAALLDDTQTALLVAYIRGFEPKP